MSDETVVTEQVETKQAGDEAAEGENTAPEGSQQEQLVVTIGEEPAPETGAEEEGQQAPAWVKKLRHRNRELEREARELKRKLAEHKPDVEPEVGEKPTLLHYDYDTDKYENALASWYERKRKADERAAKARAEVESAEQKWQAKLGKYQQAKTAFRADDFAEVEAVVLDLLDQTQQGIIVHGANDPATVVYALGKNEEKAKELAAIKDPVEFAFAVARLEGQVKVTSRKPATPPETKVSGSERPSGAVDPALDRLREEAARTGDYSKVYAYKKAKRS